MHQDSQNSGKPTYIEGHNFGQVSAVITNGTISRSLPLITELQASPKKNEGTTGNAGESLVSQMISLTYRAAKAIGKPVYAALDAYFSSGVAWSAAESTIDESGVKHVEIVTRAQSNTVAYMDPEPPKSKKRGRPRKYGDKIMLYNLFADTSNFKQTTMSLYGKITKVKYLCLDLTWKPVKKPVRFVAVESNSGKCVLMSSDLSLSPEDIISVYTLRFKIETSFDEQKNDMGGFAYHFWTSALPKRKKWKSIESVSDANKLKRIEKAKQAMEAFVVLNTIATGLLTVIAFTHNGDIWNCYPGWIKTVRSSVPTVATVKMSLSHVFHDVLPCLGRLPSFAFFIPLLRRVVYWYSNAA